MKEKGKECILCGEEDKDGKDLSEWIDLDDAEEGEQIYACFECLAFAAISELEGREKQPWWKPRINWGFWVLIGGFIAFLIGWFIVRPRLGG